MTRVKWLFLQQFLKDTYFSNAPHRMCFNTESELKYMPSSGLLGRRLRHWKLLKIIYYLPAPHLVKLLHFRILYIVNQSFVLDTSWYVIFYSLHQADAKTDYINGGSSHYYYDRRFINNPGGLLDDRRMRWAPVHTEPTFSRCINFWFNIRNVFKIK